MQRLPALILALVGALTLAGCGGGSKTAPRTPTPPEEGGGQPLPIALAIDDLPAGHTLMTGTIPAGATRTVHEANGIRTVVRCLAGGADCRIMVASDGSATVLDNFVRVETVRIMPTPTPEPEPTPGGGSGAGGTAGTTWEQLPSLVDRLEGGTGGMTSASSGHPGPHCDEGSRAICQTVVKTMLAAATEPTGTTRRFQGTRTLQTEDGVSVTENYWGGWLDNSFFVAGHVLRPVPSETGATRWQHRFSLGIRDSNPVTGVYRGEAVDFLGNWGTSRLTYTSGTAGGQVGLTINMPAHAHRGEMRWSNIPVDDSGQFDNGIRERVVGSNFTKGHFYQGGEVGGRFTWRWSLDTADGVWGVFGAKLTP